MMEKADLAQIVGLNVSRHLPLNVLGLHDRSDEIEESHYMNDEGRCP